MGYAILDGLCHPLMVYAIRHLPDSLRNFYVHLQGSSVVVIRCTFPGDTTSCATQAYVVCGK